ncbi:hypothetical protein QT989_14815 [Microcoleus sp. SVA1_B6]
MQFVDEAVYTNTGKRLNNLQRRIIAGILKGQRYADVAETHDYIAILSDFLDGEKLKVLLYKKSRNTRGLCVVRLRSDCYSSQHVKKASHELLQMLSEVFGEPVKKSNLESVLERQINQNINLGKNNNFQNNRISYVNNCPNPSTPTPDETQQETPESQPKTKNQTKIETIDKLRQFGLSHEQIAEALDIPLELVKQVDFEE